METRQLKGIWGYYHVTADGHVYNSRTGAERKPHKGQGGYYNVTLPVDLGETKRFKVHKLVYEAFHGPVPAGMQIDHINRDKTDNRLENLRAVTPRENSHNSALGGTIRRGIYLQKDRGRWVAKICLQGKPYYLGIYENQVDAQAAYNKALDDYQVAGKLPVEKPKPSKDVKHCSGCGQWLPRDRFYYLAAYKRYTALCKDCHCKYGRDLRAERRKEKQTIS